MAKNLKTNTKYYLYFIISLKFDSKQNSNSICFWAILLCTFKPNIGKIGFNWRQRKKTKKTFSKFHYTSPAHAFRGNRLSDKCWPQVTWPRRPLVIDPDPEGIAGSSPWTLEKDLHLLKHWGMGRLVAAVDIDTLITEQNGHRFADDIFKCILLKGKFDISV